MEATLFGTHLVRPIAVTEAEQQAYEQACEAAKENNTEAPLAP